MPQGGPSFASTLHLPPEPLARLGPMVTGRASRGIALRTRAKLRELSLSAGARWELGTASGSRASLQRSDGVGGLSAKAAVNARAFSGAMAATTAASLASRISRRIGNTSSGSISSKIEAALRAFMPS